MPVDSFFNSYVQELSARSKRHLDGGERRGAAAGRDEGRGTCGAAHERTTGSSSSSSIGGEGGGGGGAAGVRAEEGARVPSIHPPAPPPPTLAGPVPAAPPKHARLDLAPQQLQQQPNGAVHPSLLYINGMGGLASPANGGGGGAAGSSLPSLLLQHQQQQQMAAAAAAHAQLGGVQPLPPHMQMGVGGNPPPDFVQMLAQQQRVLQAQQQQRQQAGTPLPLPPLIPGSAEFLAAALQGMEDRGMRGVGGGGGAMPASSDPNGDASHGAGGSGGTNGGGGGSHKGKSFKQQEANKLAQQRYRCAGARGVGWRWGRGGCGLGGRARGQGGQRNKQPQQHPLARPRCTHTTHPPTHHTHMHPPHPPRERKKAKFQDLEQQVDELRAQLAQLAAVRNRNELLEVGRWLVGGVGTQRPLPPGRRPAPRTAPLSLPPPLTPPLSPSPHRLRAWLPAATTRRGVTLTARWGGWRAPPVG